MVAPESFFLEDDDDIETEPFLGSRVTRVEDGGGDSCVGSIDEEDVDLKLGDDAFLLLLFRWEGLFDPGFHMVVLRDFMAITLFLIVGYCTWKDNVYRYRCSKSSVAD